MSYGIKLHVWGDYALFTRPEMKVERVSYEVMTPSAARGILEAIYWKPQIRWNIRSIEVLKPIRFTNIRRNEVGKKATAPTRTVMAGEPGNLGLIIEDERQQRASMLLRDVAYVIEAWFDVLDYRLERDGPELPNTLWKENTSTSSKGELEPDNITTIPYFGCREFPAHFALLDDDAPSPPSELPADQRNRSLGWMLHDIAYIPDAKGPMIESNQGRRLRAEPRFFNAELKDGVLEVPPSRPPKHDSP